MAVTLPYSCTKPWGRTEDAHVERAQRCPLLVGRLIATKASASLAQGSVSPEVNPLDTILNSSSFILQLKT